MERLGRKSSRQGSGGRPRWWQKEISMDREGFGRVSIILAFVIPFTIMLALFFIKSIYPFGDRSFLFSDMYHQYMPFFSEFMHKIKEGEGLAYSYNVGIGSNFLALYVYYLASPLHWLAFLFPVDYLMEFMSYLVIIKVGLCGLTCCIYLRHRFQTKDGAILFFSCFYALSGFLAAYNWNIMWIDCVILLPLIVMGLEKLVKEGRWGLYCVTLSLSIFTNYYISIMICIFLVLYFLFLMLTEKRSWAAIRNFAVFSLLAAGMAAILLVPEVVAILETDFGDMDFPKKLESYFSVFDMMARHSLSVAAERGLDHWPNIYCGVAVFMLLPMYVLNQKISIRRRFGTLALAGFMLLGFSTNMLDFIWHGLNYPDSLPGRQSFIYIFLILVMCYEAFRRVDEVEEKHILYGYLASVVFLLASEKFVDHEDFDIGIEFLTLGFVTVYAILLYLHRTRKSLAVKKTLVMVTLVAVIAETGINTYCTSIGTVSRSQYLGQEKDYEALYQQVRSQDDSFYRMEKFTRRTKNDGTLTGYPTASVFSSTLNSYVMDLYKRWGMRHSKVYYGYDGATGLTSALLNVKYMYGENDTEGNSMYTLNASSGEIYLYESKAVLPFGYVAPKEYDLPDGYVNEGIKLQNRMVKELGINQELFEEVPCVQSGDDVKITVEDDGIYYAMVTASGTRKIDASSKAGSRSFNDLKDGSIIYLGQQKKQDMVTLSNGDDDDDSREISLNAYKMNENVLNQVLDMLSKQHMENVIYDTTHISGDIQMAEPGRLILSVPFEKGWKVLVNGEKTEPVLFGGTLMAFDLEAGGYQIQMSYTPHGANLGILISAVSIPLFLLLMSLERRKRRGDGKSGSINEITDSRDEERIDHAEENLVNGKEENLSIIEAKLED